MGLFNKSEHKKTFKLGITWGMKVLPFIEVDSQRRTIEFTKGPMTNQVFNVDQITGITSEQRGLSWYVNIFASGTLADSFKLQLFVKANQNVVDECMSYIKSLQKNSNQQATQPANKVAGFEALEKLHELKNKGIITEEEFLSEKKKALG